MLTIKSNKNKVKAIIKFIVDAYQETPTEKEWKEYHNVSLWTVLFEKWLALLEWITILGVLEAIKLNTNMWQLNILLSSSWCVFYFYIYSIVIIATSKITILGNRFIWISIVLSGIISTYLYSLVNEIVLQVLRY